MLTSATLVPVYRDWSLEKLFARLELPQRVACARCALNDCACFVLPQVFQNACKLIACWRVLFYLCACRKHMLVRSVEWVASYEGHSLFAQSWIAAHGLKLGPLSQ